MHEASNIRRILPHELDAVTAHTRARELRHELHGALGLRMKHGVATADIGLHRMIHSGAIAERNPMFLARSTARLVVATVREERGDHAMFHMEQRHWMVKNDLHPRTERRLREREEL